MLIVNICNKCRWWKYTLPNMGSVYWLASTQHAQQYTHGKWENRSVFLSEMWSWEGWNPPTKNKGRRTTGHKLLTSSLNEPCSTFSDNCIALSSIPISKWFTCIFISSSYYQCQLWSASDQISPLPTNGEPFITFTCNNMTGSSDGVCSAPHITMLPIFIWLSCNLSETSRLLLSGVHACAHVHVDITLVHTT